MKVTKENVFDLPIGPSDKRTLRALLDDVENINNSNPKAEIYIDWEDQHTKYSPERTEPCPDYEGTYRIYCNHSETYLGVEMDLDTLDTALCLLHNYLIYD